MSLDRAASGPSSARDATRRRRKDGSACWSTASGPTPSTAQEEEQHRLARDLHDETGQSLTSLLVGLRTRDRQGANVRQILGRPGEVWAPESGVDRLVVFRRK